MSSSSAGDVEVAARKKPRSWELKKPLRVEASRFAASGVLVVAP
jgi:hypothetical protein